MSICLLVISSDSISEHIAAMWKMGWLRLKLMGRVSRDGEAEAQMEGQLGGPSVCQGFGLPPPALPD